MHESVAETMGDGFFDMVSAAFWRAGWRPVLTASLFAVFGVLAGYLLGWFGVGTTVFGVGVVAVGVLLPSVRKTSFVAVVVAVVVFFGVGPERVEDTLESIGIGTVEPTEAVSQHILELASFAGIEPAGEPTNVVGSAVAWLAVSSLLGMAVGASVWFVCAQYVNKKCAGVRGELVKRVSEAGSDVLGDDGELYTLTNPEGWVRFVEPAERYDIANLLVGESSVTLHHGSTVDMVSRTAEIGDRTEEIYYDQISSVGYDGRRLRIRTADGESVKVVTDEKPVDLLEEMERRLQGYKDKEEEGTYVNGDDERDEKAEEILSGDEGEEDGEGGNR